MSLHFWCLTGRFDSSLNRFVSFFSLFFSAWLVVLTLTSSFISFSSFFFYCLPSGGALALVSTNFCISLLMFWLCFVGPSPCTKLGLLFLFCLARDKEPSNSLWGDHLNFFFIIWAVSRPNQIYLSFGCQFLSLYPNFNLFSNWTPPPLPMGPRMESSRWIWLTISEKEGRKVGQVLGGFATL